MEEIKVIIKEPGQPMREALIKNELTEFQNLVGGYIETIRPLENKNIVAVINDNSKIDKLIPNFLWRNDIIVGTVIFTKSNNDGEFISLNKNDIIQIKKFLNINDAQTYVTSAELYFIVKSIIDKNTILELEVAELKEQLNQEAQKHV